jgi:hypothetical protein
MKLKDELEQIEKFERDSRSVNLMVGPRPRQPVSAPPLFWLMVLFAVLCLAMMFLSGCAKADKRLPIVFAPVNPDVAAVSTIVAQTKASTAKASESASRAVQIVERLVVAPGQEIELERLKLELSTTIEQLSFANEFLGNANKQVDILSGQVNDMKLWGVEQNRLYVTEYETSQKERKRADAEHKAAFQNGRERDVFVTLAAIIAASFAFTAIRPLLWKVPYPPLGPLAVMVGAPLVSFGIVFFALRLAVKTIVALTT